MRKFSRLPKHVGLIPDGNRRWAKNRGLMPAMGYAAGMEAGLRLLDECHAIGIEEASVYGFTTDNTKRPREQREAFSQACVLFVQEAMKRPISLSVIGDYSVPSFPAELRKYAAERQGTGGLKVNLLVNYGWQWDIQTAICNGMTGRENKGLMDQLGSSAASRIDLMIRWGGMRRLSGFLPIQTVYSDFYVVDALWPDYQVEQFYDALDWYALQDVTLGG